MEIEKQIEDSLEVESKSLGQIIISVINSKAEEISYSFIKELPEGYGESIQQEYKEELIHRVKKEINNG